MVGAALTSRDEQVSVRGEQRRQHGTAVLSERPQQPRRGYVVHVHLGVATAHHTQVTVLRRRHRGHLPGSQSERRVIGEQPIRAGGYRGAANQSEGSLGSSQSEQGSYREAANHRQRLLRRCSGGVDDVQSESRAVWQSITV